MSNFDFDAGTRSFSKKNAYGLGKASQLAYDKKDELQPKINGYGFGEYEFFDEKDTQAFIAGNDDKLS